MSAGGPSSSPESTGSGHFTLGAENDAKPGLVSGGGGGGGGADVSLGATVGRWTPYVGVAWRPEHIEGRVPSLAQAGTGVRVARDAQVDVTVSMGLNNAESAWSVSAGVAIRHRPR